MDEISDRVRECEEEKLAELMKLIEYYGFNLNDGQTKAVLDFMVLDTMYWVLEPNPHYYDEKQIAEFIKF